MINELFTVALILPLVAAVVITFSRNRLLNGLIASLAVGSSFIASLLILMEVNNNGGSHLINYLSDWLIIPGIKSVDISFTVDSLNALMSTLLYGLATLILIYSIDYMKGHNYDIRRFYFLMLMFVTSMSVVINASNLILMFIGWECISICSYLLIGYYYRDEPEYWIGGPEGKKPLHPPSSCASLVLMTTGSADALMLLGIITLIYLSGSPYYSDIINVDGWILNSDRFMVITSLSLITVGIISKSAQFPFYFWLPYAMAGPTPVSALLHSATLVKAGVYLMLRLMPALIGIREYYADLYMLFYAISAIGAISAVLGALNAGVSIELKRMLAYSTISQIGFMFIILGVAGFSETLAEASSAGLYHLINHAVFKSALFLIAGVVIHISNSKYLSEVGLGLRNARFFITTLIPSLSLLGIPPLLGYWSKDFIAEILLIFQLYPLMVVIIMTSFLTAYYVTRMLIFMFSGSNKQIIGDHDLSKLVEYPIMALALFTLIAGFRGGDIKGLVLNLLHGIEIELSTIAANPMPSIVLLLATIAGILACILRHEGTLIHRLVFNKSFDFIIALTNRPNKSSIHKIIERATYSIIGYVRIILHSATLKVFANKSTIVGIINNLNTALRDYVKYFQSIPLIVTIIECSLDRLVGILGSNAYKYLSKLFNVVGYADIYSYLMTYVITLAVLLTYLIVAGAWQWWWN